MTFNQRLIQAIKETGSLVCVGLDSDVRQLPSRFRKRKDSQFGFNTEIIEQTAPYTLAYKPNIAFYESEGPKGLRQLQQTVAYIKAHYPQKMVILDAKRGDIESTNVGYAGLAYDYLGVDALTVNPYLGYAAIKPFLDREERGVFILCKTSNVGGGEIQDLPVVTGNRLKVTKKLWEVVAEKVAREWNARDNCGLVVGATYPAELKQVRILAPGLPFLIPGIGAQGGDLAKILKAGWDKSQGGLVISSSRGIIFAEDPAAAVKKVYRTIQGFRT